MSAPSSDLLKLAAIAQRAGAAIMEVYDAGFEVVTKADASPLTQADLRADAIIQAGLAQDFPGIDVVSEETDSSGFVNSGRFFLVDPLDGTKEFINRRPEFTVNIALIENAAPVYAALMAPAQNVMWVGDVRLGAWKAICEEGATQSWAWSRVSVRPRPAGGLSAVGSRSHSNPETNAYLDQFEVADRVSIGSSLKFCLVAEGTADLYPRIAPTCEWDTAAGDCVLRAAGGLVKALDGDPLVYGKPNFFNPGFIAGGDADYPGV